MVRATEPAVDEARRLRVVSAETERVLHHRRRTYHPKSAPGPAGSLAGVPVLLVEDDGPTRKLLSLLLTNAGALVTAVVSAEEALASIASSMPSIVVIDLVLPRMGGLVLAEQLAADPATCDIAVVAVTSLDGPDVKRIALTAGCRAYLSKPIDTETFAATVAMQRSGKE